MMGPAPGPAGISPSLKLGCSPRSTLSEANPPEIPTQTALTDCSQLPGATRWSGKDLGFGVR